MSDFSNASVPILNKTAEAVAGVGIGKPKWVSRKILADLTLVGDMAALIASAWASYYIYLETYLGAPIDRLAYLFIVTIVVALFYIIGRQRGQYGEQMDFRFSSQLSTLIYVCALTIASAFSVVFFLKIQTAFSRVWVVSWMAILLGLLTLDRALLARYVGALMKRGMLRRSVALIGAGPQFSKARTVLEAEPHDFELVGLLDLAEPDPVTSFDAAKLAEKINPFITRAQEKHVDSVMIALPSGMGLELDRIVQQVQVLPVDVQIVPDLGGASLVARNVQKMGGVYVITTASKPMTGWSTLLKRIEDIVVGGVGLVAFLPAMVVIALAIKIDSEGPVLFRQRRHGYNHRVIEVLKFRTMRVMEDGALVKQATRNDSRVTRVGAFLRRTSLDELPQFLNVLRGEMSIVGPRPHALAHNSYYGTLIENYSNRHRVKPGITGWAQVNGFRGETIDPSMMEERVRYDLDYIENWSIWLDFKVMIMTPIFGFFRRSAY
jgi:putative colanic acid biosysnthesis UDP-glucose lipid carrier transferase